MSARVARLTNAAPFPVALSLPDFLALELPPREMLLAPILPCQGSMLLVAERGIGKTQFAIGAAVAVATGTQFLQFKAPKPRQVLYVDGEMPAVALQERLASAMRRLPTEVGLPDQDYFRIVTPDLVDGPMPDLSTREGQAAIECNIDGAEVVVFDNVSCLFRSGAPENEEASWREAQEWILDLRRQGISTLLVHHAGRNGKSRGTSKREDIVDTVVRLERPSDYLSTQGARFTVNFDKARGFTGEAAAPFEAWLQGDQWSIQAAAEIVTRRVFELKADGLSLRDIAAELGLSKSKVHRLLKGGGS